MKSILSSLISLQLLLNNINSQDINNEDGPQSYVSAPVNEYKPLMAKQTIPLHEIPSQVGSDTLGDCEFYLILSPETEDVIMYIIAPETYWMGIGFGETQMDGTLAYIYSMNEDKEYQVWEYELGDHVINKKKKKIKSYQVQTVNGYTTVMLQRPFNGNPGEYDFSIYDDNLKYVIACGATPFIQFHDIGFRANWIGLTMLPPPTEAPTSEPTVRPTFQPTLTPTSNPTSKPTTNPSLTPTNYPTIKPSKNPTFNPSNQPTSNPTAKPTLKPSMNPTNKPESPESPEIIDVFVRENHTPNRDRDRDRSQQTQQQRPEQPRMPNINDITNNNCALDVVFVVDTSKFGPNECIVQGNYIEALMWSITEKNSDSKASKFSVITFNGCQTIKHISFEDNWMNKIIDINFCLNESILTNNECDQCLDGFSLAFDQFQRSSPNKKVVVFITNSECGDGICQNWGLRNIRDTEVWVYSVAHNNVIINDLQCVADYEESFADAWTAYTTGDSEDKFITNACVNLRRGGGINNNRNNNRQHNMEQIDIIGGLGIEREDRDNRFGNRDNSIRNRFGTDEERFGRNNDNDNNNNNNEDRFGNFFEKNKEIDGNVNFFNGNRPNAGFWKRLENGGGISNTVNDNDITFEPPRNNVFPQNTGFPQSPGFRRNADIGMGRALSGDITKTNNNNNNQMETLKGQRMPNTQNIEYQNELRSQATVNQKEVISKRDTMRQEIAPPNYIPQHNYGFDEKHKELNEKATYMQQETINKRNNIILPNPPQMKGMTPQQLQIKGDNNNQQQRYTTNNNIDLDNNRQMNMDRMQRPDNMQKGGNTNNNMDNNNNRMNDVMNKGPPYGINRPPPDQLNKQPQYSKGPPHGMDRSLPNRQLPDRYIQDPQYPKGPPHGMNRPLPDRYTQDINTQQFKGKDFNNMYPDQQQRNFNYHNSN